MAFSGFNIQSTGLSVQFPGFSLGGVVDVDIPSVESVVVTMPPVNAESSEETMRDMGRLGSHIIGHYFTLGSTHYVWFTHNGFGFDPGADDFDPDGILDGLTGIQVSLIAGNRTGAQVATRVAAAINLEGTFSAVAVDEDVNINGTDTAAAGTRDWDDAAASGFGIFGMQTWDLAGLNNFPNGATSAVLLDVTDLPSEELIITGFRTTVGDTHSTQMTAAIYQGGVSDTDFNGAVLLGAIGATTGTATLQNVYVPCPEPFVVDPSAGRLWVFWSHGAGGYTAPYVLTSEANPIHVAARDTSNWIIAGDNSATRETVSIGLISNPASWPASVGAVSGDTVGMPPISISYVTAAGYQNNMAVVGRVGTRAAAGTFINSSTATLIVGNSFNLSSSLGMTLFDADVNYAVHSEGSHYRVSSALGGDAINDFSGATFTDVGIADSPGIGWSNVVPTPGTVELPPNERLFLVIHHTSGGSPLTALAFDALEPDAYGPPSNPAAYYNGNTTESEYDDGFLGLPVTTNVSFDENVAQSGIIVPDGALFGNNNNVGVRARYIILGFAVS